MAVNAYLVIDGRPGPSTSKQDAIDILSFSFGASMTRGHRRWLIRRARPVQAAPTFPMSPS